MKILYLHGYAGSSNGSVKRLADLMQPDEAVIPDLLYSDPSANLAEAELDFKDKYGSEEYDMVVGVSLGGLVASRLFGNCTPVLALSSPTRLGPLSLHPHSCSSVRALYSSKDIVIADACNWGDFVSVDRNFDVPWMDDHNIDNHLDRIVDTIPSIMLYPNVVYLNLV